jgi:MSHA biogenesis protein MshM
LYLEHFGLNEPPFRMTPHTDFFFQGANRGATLEALIYAITHDEGIVKVSGEVGSGKTMLCRVLMERLPSGVETIFLANPSLSRDEILFAIADELKLDTQDARVSRVLRGLQDHLIQLFATGRRFVVLIDEAHAMPKETLEEIRLLSNLESHRHKLLQIVLFGQPELDEHLDTNDMRQLKERITHSFRLEPLVRDDIESYIDFRMRAAGYRGPNVFSAGAIRLISTASEGLTRRINILSDKALLAAFADGNHAVTEKEVRRAVRDSEFHRRRISAQKVGVVAGTLAAGLALGWGIHVLQSSGLQSSGLQSPGTRSQGSQSQRVSPGASPPATGQISDPLPRVSQLEPPSPPAGADAAPPPHAAQVQRGPGPAPAPAVAPAPAAPDASATTTEMQASPVPPAAGELVIKRFAATQEWLRTAPGDRYSIQLVTAHSSELAQLEDFLVKASGVVRARDLFVYSVKINGQQYYRAAYGSYTSAAEALNAMRELAPPLSAAQPYTRSVERMRSQNRQ